MIEQTSWIQLLYRLHQV